MQLPTEAVHVVFSILQYQSTSRPNQMLRTHQILLTGIMFVSLACNNTSATHTNDNPQGDPQPVKVSANANGDYTVFDRVRIIDNMGFSEPAYAYSILIPRGWTHQGNIIWVYQPQTQYGNGTFNEFSTRSADDKYSLKMLPEYMWMWNSDPQMNNMMMQSVYSENVSVAEPMGAEQYLRNVFIRQELKGATIDLVKPAPDVVSEMHTKMGNSLDELRQYGATDVKYHPSAVRADVRFADGTAGIVLCGVGVIETTIMNQYTGQMQTSFTSVATKRIIYKFPPAEKESAEEILAVILSSMRTNPVWKESVDKFWKNVRQQSHVVHIGKIQILDAQTRAMGEAAIRKGAQNL